MVNREWWGGGFREACNFAVAGIGKDDWIDGVVESWSGGVAGSIFNFSSFAEAMEDWRFWTSDWFYGRLRGAGFGG